MSKFLALALAAFTLQAAELPRKADFTINLPGGKQATLSSYQGKVVALAFILTTCPHCQNTTQILSRAQKDFGARGFQVLESTVEVGGEGMLPRFIDQFSPPFPVGFNPFAEAQNFMQHSAILIMHMPGLLFIDRQGRIVAQYEGDDPFMSEDKQEQNIRAKIEQLLKGAAAPVRKTTAQK